MKTRSQMRETIMQGIKHNLEELEKIKDPTTKSFRGGLLCAYKLNLYSLGIVSRYSYERLERYIDNRIYKNI